LSERPYLASLDFTQNLSVVPSDFGVKIRNRYVGLNKRYSLRAVSETLSTRLPGLVEVLPVKAVLA
jgi:hypothetical protein